MSALDADEAALQCGLDATQAALRVLVPTSPIQLFSVLIVHPKFVVLKYQD